MYGSLTAEAKSACSAASRPAFTAVTISMGASIERAARVGAMAGVWEGISGHFPCVKKRAPVS